MREIKYRAWDNAHNKMHYKVNLYSIGSGKSMNKAQLGQKSIMNNIGLSCKMMQWTGLKDKNGKDVYEGDIFRDTYEDEGGDIITYYQVSWLNEWAMFALLSFRKLEQYEENGMDSIDEASYWTYHIQEIHERQVIGHTYDGKEYIGSDYRDDSLEAGDMVYIKEYHQGERDVLVKCKSAIVQTVGESSITAKYDFDGTECSKRFENHSYFLEPFDDYLIGG